MPAVQTYTEQEARDYITRTLPLLHDIIFQAPHGVIYEPSSEGFCLRNIGINVDYSRFLGFRNKFTSLESSETGLQIALRGMASPGKKQTPPCCYIQLFDDEGDGNLLGIGDEKYASFRPSNYSQAVWYGLCGEDQWFTEGTKLLSEAYDKFAIQFWIDASEGVPVVVPIGSK